MALVNALLVRWHDGYLELTDAASIATYGRREGFLSAGDAQSVEEATRIGTAVLAEKKDPRVATTAGVDPIGVGDEPYRAFTVADWITAPGAAGGDESLRVRSLTVTEDENGDPLFAPELASLVDVEEARLERWLRRMSNGTIGGSVESASPVQSSGPSTPASPARGGDALPEITFSGRLFASSSERHYVKTATTVVGATVSIDEMGATDSVVAIRKNGVNQVTVTIPAGVNKVDATFSVAYGVGDYFSAAIVTGGVGATKLNIQPITA